MTWPAAWDGRKTPSGRSSPSALRSHTARKPDWGTGPRASTARRRTPRPRGWRHRHPLAPTLQPHHPLRLPNPHGHAGPKRRGAGNPPSCSSGAVPTAATRDLSSWPHRTRRVPGGRSSASGDLVPAYAVCRQLARWQHATRTLQASTDLLAGKFAGRAGAFALSASSHGRSMGP